jgi:hypothetical protein
MNLYATIRPEAIETAIRNADKAEAAGYYVTASQITPGTFRVVKPSGEFYVTQPTIGTRGKCQCEQWNREGYCKHLELTERYQEWVESVEARADAYDEESYFFMKECQAECLAETEGAWY